MQHEQFQYYKPGAPQRARRKLHLAGFDLECGFDTGGESKFGGLESRQNVATNSEYPQGIAIGLLSLSYIAVRDRYTFRIAVQERNLREIA